MLTPMTQGEPDGADSIARCSSIPTSEVLLVLLALPLGADELPSLDCLGDEERHKLERLRSPQDLRIQAMAHLLKRLLLARITGQDAARLQFTQTELGKPLLVGGGPLGFNLAHSSTTAAVAVSTCGPTGVDCEDSWAPSLDAPEFETLIFTAGERHSLAMAPDAIPARLRLWTAKEAVLKGEGWGLSREPTRVDCGRGWVAGGSGSWRVHHYSPGGQGLAAVSVSAVAAVPVALRLDLEVVHSWVRRGRAPERLPRLLPQGVALHLVPVPEEVFVGRGRAAG